MRKSLSYILQLTELGVRNPVCSLIQSKGGISVYRVELLEAERKRLILKGFENQEDAREIDNYCPAKISGEGSG